jgi:hypothetical protein
MGISITLERGPNANIFRDLMYSIPYFRRALLDRVVERYKEILLEMYESSDSQGFPPLSPDWLHRKELAGWDLRIFHASGGLIESVESDVPTSYTGVVYFEGVDPSGKKYADIAEALEFGVADQNIPPRPIVKKAAQQLRSEIPTLLNGVFNAVLAARRGGMRIMG